MSEHLAGSYEELSAQAQQHLQVNEYDQAQKIYERIYNRLGKMKAEVIKRRPNLQQLKLTSLSMLGDLAGLHGNYDQAITYYQAGLEISPENLVYRRAIAQAKIDRGDIEIGLDELRTLAVMNAGDARPWIWLGLELWVQGNLAEATENLERVTTLSGSSPEHRSEAFSYLHDLYREAKRWPEAEAAWKQVWHTAGRKIEDVSPLYQMYWEADDLSQARSWLKQEKNPLRVGFYQGLFFHSEGNAKKAATAWSKTAAQNPLEHDSGHEAWAEAALRTQADPETVIEVIRTVVTRRQINIRTTILLAAAQLRAGRIDSAELALKAALEMGHRARPRLDQLSKDHWRLFTELGGEQATTDQLKQHFEIIEEEAGE